MLDQLSAWVIDVVESLGYGGVAFLVLLENLFPPIPSEVVLALAGFVAARGDASAPGMVVAATAGSVAGAWILYGVAALVGEARVRALVVRFGPWVRITSRDLDRAEAWFDRWQNIAVLICRCVPLVRSLISVPAGLRRMPFAPFTAYTALGSLVWNTLFVTAGYLLGEQWERAVQVGEVFQYVVLAAIAVGVIAFVVSRWRGRRARMAAGAAAVDAPPADKRERP